MFAMGGRISQSLVATINALCALIVGFSAQNNHHLSTVYAEGALTVATKEE